VADVVELKQACIDLANAANELFDRFDEHGYEAAWEGDGALVVLKMQQAHEVLREFLSLQAIRRLRGLGLTFEQIAGMGERMRDQL
jgi:hypothetical protein